MGTTFIKKKKNTGAGRQERSYKLHKSISSLWVDWGEKMVLKNKFSKKYTCIMDFYLFIYFLF